MRRAVLALLSTVAGLVLLLGYKTSPPPTTPAVVADRGGSGTTGAPGAGSVSGSGSGPTATPSPRSGPASRTVTGGVARTRYGPVQVRAVVRAGRVTSVTVLQAPQGNSRDVEINGFALPELRRATLAAGSAQIDNVSGATYTSEGYKASLQSALDAAGG